MDRQRTHTTLHPALALGIWMLVALLLRLFHITRESLWWDEYTSHVYLGASSLPEFLSLNRTLDPLTLPAYYCLEYLWTHYVQNSVLSLRLMSIAIGLATMSLVYALGRRLYGSRAGLVTAALLALSPVHIHHSQGIRMYVLFVFLVVAVAWSFVRLLDRPRPGWWLLHGLVSVLLYWTHPFAGLVPAVFGAFLLLRYRSRKWLFWCWTLFQSLLFAPTVIYLATVRFWPAASTSAWIEKPSLRALLADLFFDDIAAFHWQFRMGVFAQYLGSLRIGVDVLFAAFIAGMLLLFFLRMRRGHAAGRDPEPDRELTLLAVLWLVLPPVMLFALSLVVRPCMFPRYTVHCIVPLYLLLGGAVASLKTPFKQRFLAGTLLALMALQWLWLQPGPQRTDWRSAGLFLHEQTTKDDIVLVESLLWRDVFQHNLKHLTPGLLEAPVAAAEETGLLAAQSALCLGMLGKEDPGDLWVVIALRFFESGPPVIYEQYLKRWGISFKRWFFPAVREVYVYRLNRPEPGTLPDSMEALFAQWDKVQPDKPIVPGEVDARTKEAFGDLAMALAEKGRVDMARKVLEGLFVRDEFSRQLFGNILAALNTGVALQSRVDAVRALWQGYGFRGNGQTRHACRAFEKAVALDPRHAVANLELGFESLDLGRNAEAADAFERAASDDGRYRILGNLVKALRTNGDVDGAFEAVQAYRQGILEQSRGHLDAAAILLRRAVAADPHLDDAHTSLAFVLIVQRKIEEAQQVLGAYVNEVPSPSPGAYGLLAVTYMARNELDKAVECADRAIAMDEAYARQFGPLFQALFHERSLEKTRAALDTLKGEGMDLYPLLYDYALHLLH